MRWTCSSKVSVQPRSRVSWVWHQIVSHLRGAWRRSGREGLHGAGRAGRLPKLSHEQLAQVVSALIQGAVANRYPNELWTLQRAAQVI